MKESRETSTERDESSGELCLVVAEKAEYVEHAKRFGLIPRDAKYIHESHRLRGYDPNIKVYAVVGERGFLDLDMRIALHQGCNNVETVVLP